MTPTFPVKLRNGQTARVEKLEPELRTHGFAYYGHAMGEPQLWTEEGRWHLDGPEHPLDILPESLTEQTN